MTFTFARPVRTASFALLAASALLCSGQARAGFTNLGGNWQAEWDPSLDPFVSINLVAIVGDVIHIQKSAQFTQGPDINGLFPTIPIVFHQIGASTVTHIVIEDEIISNQTGVAWTDFHMDILDSGDASFNPALTLASGGGGPIGFSISPFTQASFANNNMQLNISGGIVPNGASWFPGDGATDGELWINVNSHWNGTTGTIFTLKETPTIPAPGALALLGLAGFVGRSRKRG